MTFVFGFLFRWKKWNLQRWRMDILNTEQVPPESFRHLAIGNQYGKPKLLLNNDKAMFDGKFYNYFGFVKSTTSTQGPESKFEWVTNQKVWI